MMTFYKGFTGLALATAICLLNGCNKKTDAATELANTVKVLGQPVPASQIPAPSNPNSLVRQPAAEQVNQALTSLKAGKYTDTIAQMEMARSNPNKTPAQTMAIQDAMAAVMSDLYSRAAKGDVAAKEAIKRYQDSRTMR